MILLSEFLGAITGALVNPEMIAGLVARDLIPNEVFCLPLIAGNFFTAEYANSRLMRLPCYKIPEGTNFYAAPIEGLFAVFDLTTANVVEVIDTGVVPIPSEPWGYSEEEVSKRAPLRPVGNPVRLSQDGSPNYSIEGSHVEWDIWRFNYRVDKRPGLVLSNIDVDDAWTWRSVLY
jgi:primary-amine oxidase